MIVCVFVVSVGKLERHIIPGNKQDARRSRSILLISPSNVLLPNNIVEMTDPRSCAETTEKAKVLVAARVNLLTMANENCNKSSKFVVIIII